MLKEQLLDLAVRALSKVYEARGRIRDNIHGHSIRSYVKNLKSLSSKILEDQLHKLMKSNRSSDVGGLAYEKPVSDTKSAAKRDRRSSIRAAKEIGSVKADIILEMLKNDSSPLVAKSDMVDGKKSLAYLVWALGHAERAKLMDGISVHDVCALLYRACDVELYPINVSRVVYGNASLVRKVDQQKRTTTYLLTTEGQTVFNEKFSIV